MGAITNNVEYADTSWADSFFGTVPPFDGKIFHSSAMIGTDVQTQLGTLVAAGGFTFHKTALGVDAILFGDGASGRGKYVPTALIAYFFILRPVTSQMATYHSMQGMKKSVL